MRSLTGAALFLAGCTSVSWKTAEGDTVHVGLVCARVVPLVHGERLERFSLGTDLRLAGPDRGASVLFHWQELVAPAEVRAVPPSLMAKEVLRHIDEPVPGPELDGSRWQFFLVRESVSSRATVARASTVGAGLQVGRLSPGLTVGWHSAWQLVGRALDDGIVHVSKHAPASTRVVSACLFTLESETDVDVTQREKDS